jgi:F-type H+-transporting ATPase subunit b
MIIDWYTIIFQIINFMILVFLLRYFLYGPIIRAMDEREELILQREKDAEKEKEEAAKEVRAFREKSEKIDQQEEEILEKARSAAEKEKRELLDQARQEVDETKRRWDEAFTREKETFITELRRRIGQQACAVARRCLEDLADSKLEELTWALFLKKISNLPQEEREALQEAISEDHNRLNLRSAFDPSPKKLKELEAGIRKILSSPEDEMTFSAKKDPGLICGLELEAGGYRVAWNIESYLDDVEEEILKELDQQAPAGQTEEVPGDAKTKD